MTGTFVLERKSLELAVRCALWAALISIGAYVSIPFGPVPITLQTFFIILCGFVEGKRGFFAVLLYLFAGLMGLPVFAGGTAGPGLLVAPSAGFALGFPFAAFVAGFSATNPKPYKYPLFGALATLLIDLSGVLGLMINLKVSLYKAIFITVPFLPGDGLKVIAASALVAGGAKAFKSVRAKSKNEVNLTKNG
jgi:biotin transport system substrate-specific component